MGFGAPVHAAGELVVLGGLVVHFLAAQVAAGKFEACQFIGVVHTVDLSCSTGIALSRAIFRVSDS